MKAISLRLFLILVLLSTIAPAQSKSTDSELSRELIGLWHASPYVAAGMNDLYRFFDDGRFIFEYNQMIWSKRTISFAGKWRVQKGKLILTITERTDIVGGQRVKSDMSADGYEIEDGTEVTRELKPPKVETKTLGKIKQGETAKFGSIGKANYWRLSKNPKEYEE
jgi:hypothetical protein